MKISHKVWLEVKWEHQNWCGVVELVRGDGKVVKAWEACAECVAADQGERTFGYDSKRPENVEADWSVRCVEGP